MLDYPDIDPKISLRAPSRCTGNGLMYVVGSVAAWFLGAPTCRASFCWSHADDVGDMFFTPSAWCARRSPGYAFFTAFARAE